MKRNVPASFRRLRHILPGLILGTAAIQPVFSASPPVPVQTVESLQSIESRMKTSSLALLTLIRDLAGRQLTGGEKVKIIRNACQVYETMNENSTVIYEPQMNEEFDVREVRDTLIRIALPDGREGWIAESCIQRFTGPSGHAKSLSEISPDLLEMTRKLYKEVTGLHVEARKILDDTGEKVPEYSELQRIWMQIDRYHHYAQTFFEDLSRIYREKSPETPAFLNRLAGRAEFLLGKETYRTSYLQGDPDLHKGTSSQISLSGSYRLNEQSDVRFDFEQRNDVIQTPFRSTRFGLGYNRGSPDRFQLRSGIRLQAYKDEVRAQNDFRRFGIFAHTVYRISDRRRFLMDYDFLRHAYSDEDTVSGNSPYGQHRLRLDYLHRLNSRWTATAGIQSVFSGSDSPFYQFTVLLPTLQLVHQGQPCRTSFLLQFERYAFQELSLRTFNRTALIVSRQKRSGGLSRDFQADISTKAYPENEAASYMLLQLRYGFTRFGLNPDNYSVTVRNVFFTHKHDNDYSDLRFDSGSRSEQNLRSLSAFLRFWHRPGARDSLAGKSHVMDLYGKYLWRFGFVYFGPTAGLHAVITPDGNVAFLKSDGDVIRIGASVEADHRWPGGFSLHFITDYEYGSVQQDEISVGGFGEITAGDRIMRHPTTLQLRLEAAFPIGSLWEGTGQIHFYQINTDMDEKLSIQPQTRNQRVTVMFGIRYQLRYPGGTP